MEKKIAIALFALLTAGITVCCICIAWMLVQMQAQPSVFADAQLVQEVLCHAAV